MNRLVLVLVLAFCAQSLQAQVPQYSQYYANALFLSPSFAGAEHCSRAILASRYQWPGLAVSYISHTLSLDHYFAQANSGVGLIINHDLITPAHLRTLDLGLAYAYELDISPKLTFRPGLQLAYVDRRIDISRLSFGSQYTDNGFIGGGQNEVLHSPALSYLEVTSGGLLISETFWVGFSGHHLNRPNQSIFDDVSRLPAKFSIYGGYKFLLGPEWKRRYIHPHEEKSISPTFMYRSQGRSDQLDLGLYGRYNDLVAGIWYRGIPVKVYAPDKFNHDAFVFMFGFIYKTWNIGYSYDITTSRLNMTTWGSHELTLSYRCNCQKVNKKRPVQKRPSCPKF